MYAVTALGVATSAGGIHSIGKAFMHKPAKAGDTETSDNPDDEEESDDDSDGDGDADEHDKSADDTRKTTAATDDESAGDES